MVALEPMQEKHFDQTCRWLAASAELRAQIDTLGVPSLEANREYWRRQLQDRSREDYAIVDGPRHIGNCGLMHIDRARGKAELWIYLGGAYGGGLGGRALELLLDRGFGELGLRRVYLRVVDSNPRAVRFYERAGFKHEGRARADTVQDGRAVDSVLMSILAGERSAAKPA
jgi:RimJ/RimL family protein N-acetyltransferase